MTLYQLDEHVPVLPQEGSYWIAPNAHIIGKVKIGKDVGIWFGAVLRGDNELINIGDETNIQENAILHTDMGYPLNTGRGCTIGHGAIVHGAILDDFVLEGMGAKILNGAKIGGGSLVGAGALVTEKKEFPPRSLIVGSPAKLVRTIEDEEFERLKLSASNYVKNWKRYANGLKP